MFSPEGILCFFYLNPSVIILKSPVLKIILQKSVLMFILMNVN